MCPAHSDSTISAAVIKHRHPNAGPQRQNEQPAVEVAGGEDVGCRGTGIVADSYFAGWRKTYCVGDEAIQRDIDQAGDVDRSGDNSPLGIEQAWNAQAYGADLFHAAVDRLPDGNAKSRGIGLGVELALAGPEGDLIFAAGGFDAGAADVDSQGDHAERVIVHFEREGMCTRRGGSRSLRSCRRFICDCLLNSGPCVFNSAGRIGP